MMDELEGCSTEKSWLTNGCINSNRVTFRECNEENPEHRWTFDFQNKRIHSQARRADLCLTRLSENLSMAACQPANLQQLWFFNQQDHLYSRVDLLDSLAFVKLLQGNTSAPSPVTFSFIESETGDDQCYLSPFTGRVECPGFEVDEESLKQQEVKLWHWSGHWPWQPKPMKLTEDLKLGDFRNNHCLAVTHCHMDSVGQSDCFGGAKIKVSACKSVSHQVWRYDLISKRLFNKQAGEQFCLSWLSGHLTLEHCLAGSAGSQRWYFSLGKGSQYGERGQLRWFSNSWEHYDYVKTLDFDPVVKVEILKKDSQGEGCGYDPIDGTWKGLCANQAI
ncbi:hypothetical protein [Endozoicomonas sp. SCSIO W0465]|uniref:hypothetical protein n=1 Tax=Endozoicomonas sp. SCSIO W0465 TaxID=2918516 RepID=UPI002074CCC6|nr:hypothetical protein [Endozoicomonas sp. SCSIO W0465]USE37082.1 hypothetical protein MJO57_02295 [Endozoicomonas sp. SCSIO W0465]